MELPVPFEHLILAGSCRINLLDYADGQIVLDHFIDSDPSASTSFASQNPTQDVTKHGTKDEGAPIQFLDEWEVVYGLKELVKSLKIAQEKKASPNSRRTKKKSKVRRNGSAPEEQVINDDEDEDGSVVDLKNKKSILQDVIALEFLQRHHYIRLRFRLHNSQSSDFETSALAYGDGRDQGSSQALKDLILLVYLVPTDLPNLQAAIWKKGRRSESMEHKASGLLKNLLLSTHLSLTGEGEIVLPTNNDLSLLEIYNSLPSPSPDLPHLSRAYANADFSVRSDLDCLFPPTSTSIPPLSTDRSTPTNDTLRPEINVSWETAHSIKTPLYSYQRKSVWALRLRETTPVYSTDPRWWSLKSLPPLKSSPGSSPKMGSEKGGWSNNHKKSLEEVKEYYIDENYNARLEPQLCLETRGGIICDEMGTGKTFISLALIMSTKGMLPDLSDVADVEIERPDVRPVVMCDFSRAWSNEKYETEKAKEKGVFAMRDNVDPLFGDDIRTGGFEDVRMDVDMDRGQRQFPSLKLMAAHRLLCSGREVTILTKEDRARMGSSPLVELLDNSRPFYLKRYVPRMKYRLVAPMDNSSQGTTVASATTMSSLMPDKEKDRKRRDAPPSYRRIYLTKANLLVVPGNLLVQWKEEMDKHLDMKDLNVLVVAASGGKIPSAFEICRYDIVLMNSSRFSKEETLSDEATVEEQMLSELCKVHWKRVIVDEGHTLGGSSRFTTLVERIRAQSKFIVTGTPSVNLLGYQSVTSQSNENGADVEVENNLAREAAGGREDFDKIGRMLAHILRVEPFCHTVAGKGSWKSSIAEPYLSNGIAANQVATVLGRVMIRNSPEDVAKDVLLPPLSKKVVSLPFGNYQRLTYNSLLAMFAINSVDSERVGTDYFFHPKNQKQLSLLMTNLHLSHLYFGSEDLIAQMEKGAANGMDSINLRGSTRSSIDRNLMEGAVESLAEALDNIYWRNYINWTQVGYLCTVEKNVWEELPFEGSVKLKQGDFTFTSGEEILRLRRLVDMVRKDNGWGDEEEFFEEVKTVAAKKDHELASSKKRKRKATDDAVCVLRDLPSSVERATVVGCESTKVTYTIKRILQEPSEKFLIFSQHANNIYNVSRAFEVAGLRHHTYSSHVKGPTREAAALKFQADPDCKVLLVELKYASHGINLCKATRIIFLEPVWSPDTEAQAIKRGHRIGQTKEVRVEILCMKNSFEEAMLERKREMTKKDFEETSTPQDDIRLRDLLQSAKFISKKDSTQVTFNPCLPFFPRCSLQITDKGSSIFKNSKSVPEKIKKKKENESRPSPKRRRVEKGQISKTAVLDTHSGTVDFFGGLFQSPQGTETTAVSNHPTSDAISNLDRFPRTCRSSSQQLDFALFMSADEYEEKNPDVEQQMRS